jgi:hypothetical protein
MRLRSLTKHFREQNWFAVILDFVIVVVGILIAFQITNWNESRQNDIQAQRFLERLEQDFNQTLLITEHSLANHKQSLQASSRLIKGLKVGLFDQELLIHDIRYSTDFSTPPGPSAAFQELVSSGKTNLIRSETLRNALYEYNGYVSFLRDSYMTFTAPILKAQSSLMQARTLVATGTPSEDFGQLGHTESFDSSKLLDKPEILDLLQLLYLTHDNIHLVLQEIHDRLEKILASIRAEKETTQ